MKMKNSESYRNEIKSYIVRAGMTMNEAVELFADVYGSGSLRCGKAAKPADALGYDFVQQKRKG